MSDRTPLELGKYEGHTEGPWTVMVPPEPSRADHGWRTILKLVHGAHVMVSRFKNKWPMTPLEWRATEALVVDAPALLSEVLHQRSLIRELAAALKETSESLAFARNRLGCTDEGDGGDRRGDGELPGSLSALSQSRLALLAAAAWGAE